MKTKLFFVFALFLGAVNAQSTSSPVEYMNYFSSQYEQVQTDVWDYTRTVSHGRSARKVEKRRKEMIEAVESAKRKSTAAKGFQGETTYRDSVVYFFDIMGKVLREDYAELVNMEEIAEQSYDLMEAYMNAKEAANDKLDEAGDIIDRVHKSFADKHGITIIENDSKLSAKMEIAGKVYDHYNAVFLIFFKSNKQELYLLDAIQSKDVSAIEQNRNALLSTIEEGREKLKTLKLYEGDKSMIIATKQLFDFYEKEAQEDAQTALNFIEENERFAKIKEAFDKKKAKDRTQKDVDAFNNGVNSVNKSVAEFNEMNDSTNKMRANLINAWNKTAEKFTSKHVPKGK